MAPLKGTPDYLMAHSAAGHLMGSTCDWPAGYGATWQALMENQGGTVTRLTLDQYRERAGMPQRGQPVLHEQHGPGLVKAILPDAVVVQNPRGEFLAPVGTFKIGDRLTYSHEGEEHTGTVRGLLNDGQLRVVGDGLNVMHDIPAPAPDEYGAFLAGKHYRHDAQGLPTAPDDLSDTLAPFQQAIVAFCLTKGRAALFADTGLGKTRMQLVWADEVARNGDGRVLILAPLAVAQQTVREGEAIGVPVHYTRSGDDLTPGVNITNYEMLEHFNPADFVGVVLDESSILKSFTGKTRTALIDAFQQTPYRLACTATPAPNDYTEIGNHSEFLGVLNRVEMLATYFVHDGGDTGVWRLKGHAEAEFWQWCSSWAVAVRRPSDLGYSDAGYDLPPLSILKHKIEVETEAPEGMLFAVPAQGLTAQRTALRESLEDRCAAVAAWVNAEPDEPWLVWCELNAEGDRLAQLIPGAVQVSGSDTREEKEAAMLAFSRGEIRVLISKPSLCGFGMNWQHCARVAFAQVTNSFEQTYQAIRRCYRFGQARPVVVRMAYGELEASIVGNLERKEREAQAMTAAMVSRMTFQQGGPASARGLEAYRPTQPMTLPEWLKGRAA